MLHTNRLGLNQIVGTFENILQIVDMFCKLAVKLLVVLIDLIPAEVLDENRWYPYLSCDSDPQLGDIADDQFTFQAGDRLSET